VRSNGKNTFGVLAVVRAVSGILTQTQSLGSQSSYLSQNALEAHFGLGASTRIDRLEVRFPNGKVKVIRNIPADRILVVNEEGS
jgi:hypothetical protein